jgi:hypothetical protein
MNKYLTQLFCIYLFFAYPLVSNAIEFRTLPLIYPQGGADFQDRPSTFAIFKEGVIVDFTYNDSLQYFNGNNWEVYSKYSKKKYGQPGKIVSKNDNIYILKFGNLLGTTDNIYKIKENGEVEEIVPNFDSLESVTSFGNERSIKNIEVDKDGNLYIISSISVIQQLNPYKLLFSRDELIKINQDGEILEYYRNHFTSYPTYNTRETLPGNDGANIIEVTENGNIYLTGQNNLASGQPPFWEYSNNEWKKLDIGFNTNVNKVFEPRKIHELNGNIYVTAYSGFSETPFGGVLLEKENSEWTSYGFKNADVNIPLNHPIYNKYTLRITDVADINGEVYAASGGYGIMKINKNDFVSYPILNDNKEDYIVTSLIKAQNSTWVIVTNPKLNGTPELRLIDPVGLIETSVEDDTTNSREILSIEYCDMIGKILTESEINTGIPHFKYTKYKDGGFRVQKLIVK